MVYVKLNKCASTAIARMVQDSCTVLHYTRIAPRNGRPGGWLARERIKDDFCFTAVRHPDTRAVSMFQHCLRLGFKYSFREWLEKDFTEMEPSERAHSMRMTDFVTDCAGLGILDTAFRIEDGDLERKIQVLTGTTNTLGREAVGGYGEMNISDYEMELIRKKYFLDFENFGYNPTA